MQLFRSEGDVDEWVGLTGHARGAVFSPDQLWDLAGGWYDDRLELNWRRRTTTERQAILDRVGLTGEFWDLAGSP